MNKRVCTAVGVCASALLAGAAQADLLQVTFSGTVTQVDAGAPAMVGDTWSYEFTVDTDLVVSLPPQGGFAGALQDHQGGLVGPATLTLGAMSDTGSYDRLRVLDDYKSFSFDTQKDGLSISAVNQGYLFGGVGQTELLVDALSFDLSTFTGTSIPTALNLTPPDAGFFQLGFTPNGTDYFYVNGATESAVIRVVPTPGAAMVAGLGGLVATRRRRR